MRSRGFACEWQGGCGKYMEMGMACGRATLDRSPVDFAVVHLRWPSEGVAG